MIALRFLPLSLLAALPLQAAVVISTNSEVGPGGVGSTFTPTYVASASDLINGRTPSASAGEFGTLELSGGLPVLTNGTYGFITEPGGAPDRSHASFALAGGGSSTGTSVTYTLDTLAAPLGYNLSSIAVYGGWNDNGRDQQLYTASYRLLGSAAFVDLPTVNFNPPAGANLQSATRTILSNDSAPFIASGVDAVRFTFNNPAPENGYTGYSEIDVFGTAVIPEPTSSLLLALAALGMRHRRR